MEFSIGIGVIRILIQWEKSKPSQPALQQSYEDKHRVAMMLNDIKKEREQWRRNAAQFPGYF